MSNSKNYWTTPRKDGNWAVKREGTSKASAVFDNQLDAWSDTRRRARGSEGEALLQGKNGKIRTRNTYGKDPHPPKG